MKVILKGITVGGRKLNPEGMGFKKTVSKGIDKHGYKSKLTLTV